MNHAHTFAVVTASFLASLVEFVEALTIVLAVGTTRGWRSALFGAGVGAIVLALLIALFGSALAQVPIQHLQLGIGILLLMFGMRWLRKAALRTAGVIGMHDETAIYERETAALRDVDAAERLDRLGALTTFKAVMLEGLEVVFIVIAIGHDGTLGAAAGGAAIAGALVIVLGVALHRPLARVPENTLKFIVGALLSAFGVFWVGEGLGMPWPGEDLALPMLIGGFMLAGLLAARVAHPRRHSI